MKSSFSSHISQQHCKWTSRHVSETCRQEPHQRLPTGENENSVVGEVPSTSELDGSQLEFHEHDTQPELPQEELNTEDDISLDDYTKAVALLYLKLQAKHHVSQTVIQDVVDGIIDITTISKEKMKVALKKSLLEKVPDLQQPEIESILDDVFSNDAVSIVHDQNTGKLRSTYMRNCYNKNNFNYTSPVSVKLGKDEQNIERFAHYVPIKKTLLSLFKDKGFHKQYEAPLQGNQNFFCDISDGSVFQNNELFSRIPGSLQIILYQDGFEIVNPLGSAKCKHKLLGVYFTLGNIYPYNRSKVDTLQLVLLCREADLKYFGPEKIFKPLVLDLMDLEATGIDIGNGQQVKGTLTCIVGDNLGSHSIGGFTEHFGGSSYSCRYCFMKMDDFKNGDRCSDPCRSKERYNQALKFLEENPGVSSFEGVKQDSVFNKLQNFHVCDGLPPCLGHDLFEGVVQYDLALCLKYFIREKKWFTVKDFNAALHALKLKGEDAKDRPVDIKDNLDKLRGHAVQNWCLLRNLPLIIGKRIRDIEDNVWSLCMMLRHIVELVCANKISAGQITYLRTLTTDYLDLRCLAFPEVQLRPKHHYLEHYADLIVKFGPLMRV